MHRPPIFTGETSAGNQPMPGTSLRSHRLPPPRVLLRVPEMRPMRPAGIAAVSTFGPAPAAEAPAATRWLERVSRNWQSPAVRWWVALAVVLGILLGANLVRRGGGDVREEPAAPAAQAPEDQLGTVPQGTNHLPEAARPLQPGQRPDDGPAPWPTGWDTSPASATPSPEAAVHEARRRSGGEPSATRTPVRPGMARLQGTIEPPAPADGGELPADESHVRF